MAATANIIIETKEGILLVPIEAVQTTDRGSVIRILEDGKIRMQKVEVGIFSDTQIEIVSGLFEGDVVVTGTGSGFSSTGQGAGNSPFNTFRFGGAR